MFPRMDAIKHWHINFLNFIFSQSKIAKEFDVLFIC